MSGHTCHADDCTLLVRPEVFMCRRHWFMVPKVLRDAVWREYRPGQEVTKTPTNGYLVVARAAIAAVAKKGGKGPNDG
jgi:hypothetical protein